MHTERITYLSTADQKAALEAFAKARGESVGNVVREATAHFIGKEQDEEEQLAAVVAELIAALPEMRASLQRTAKRMEDTADEVEQMLRKAGIRK